MAVPGLESNTFYGDSKFRGLGRVMEPSPRTGLSRRSSPCRRPDNILAPSPSSTPPPPRQPSPIARQQVRRELSDRDWLGCRTRLSPSQPEPRPQGRRHVDATQSGRTTPQRLSRAQSPAGTSARSSVLFQQEANLTAAQRGRFDGRFFDRDVGNTSRFRPAAEQRERIAQRSESSERRHIARRAPSPSLQGVLAPAPARSFRPAKGAYHAPAESLPGVFSPSRTSAAV